VTGQILVIEDNQDNITLIDYLLTAHGYLPLLARNGADGVRLAIEHHPDVVLLDIRMVGMDGYEVATILKGESQLRDVKIIAVTASAMVGDRESIVAAGFDGYIDKPIDPETFVASVEQWLPAHERSHESASDA